MKKRILLIDVFFFNQMYIKKIIKNKYDIDIMIAVNCESAIDLLKDSKPDLIIVSPRIPGCPANQLVNNIRNIEELCNVTIILTLVGMETKDKIEVYKNNGITDFISRPLTNENLCQVMDKWL